jgi:hypothetical protein
VENLNEVEMLELLQLTNEDLIGAFSDTIEDKFDFICEKYGVPIEV